MAYVDYALFMLSWRILARLEPIRGLLGGL